MPTTVLVACCGKKLVGKHAAKDIYQSQLFRKARAWAERHGDDWFILSAKYGVVAPDDQIDTYDLALNTTSREYRLEWAGRVATKLRDVAKGRLVVLAGENYCQAWPEHFQFVERPLKGLGIGKQLAWLTQSEGLRPDLAPMERRIRFETECRNRLRPPVNSHTSFFEIERDESV